MHSHPERGGIIGTIFLAMGAVVLVAMVCTVGFGLYVAHHIRVEATDGNHGKNVDVETPFGSVHVSEDTQADLKRLGVPVYPGARLDSDHRKVAHVELNFGHEEDQKFAVVAGEYTTSDPIDKVREYYRSELPHWMVSDERHGKVQISLQEGGYRKIIVLEDEGGATRIKLCSIGQPMAN